MTEMQYSQPEPEFTAPADINQKEEVILTTPRQQEMDEISARVRAINAGKMFEAKQEPFPKTGIKQPPKAEPEHQEIHREPPIIERRKQFTLTSNKRTPAEIDRIIRSGRFYTVEGGKSIKLNNVYLPQQIVQEVEPVEGKPKKKGWFK